MLLVGATKYLVSINLRVEDFILIYTLKYEFCHPVENIATESEVDWWHCVERESEQEVGEDSKSPGPPSVITPEMF